MGIHVKGATEEASREGRRHMHRPKAEGTLSGERDCNAGLDAVEKSGRMGKG